MHPIQRRLLLLLSAGAFAVASNQGAAISDNRESGAKTGPSNGYAPTSQEFYLSEDQIAWIRPGLNITIVGVTDLAPGKKPVVEFTIADDLKQPLDRLGGTTPGPVSVSFILSKWDPATRYYVPYTFRVRNGVTNPSADQGGTFTEVAIGRYKYTFGTTLPADMSLTATNTLGAYGSRNMSASSRRTTTLRTFSSRSAPMAERPVRSGTPWTPRSRATSAMTRSPFTAERAAR